MPLVTFIDFVDGNIPSGEGILENFHSTFSPPNALSIINGYLDFDNLKDGLSDRSVTYPYLQAHSVSGGKMVAGTANLDYFAHQGASEAQAVSGIYQGRTLLESSKKNAYVAIPGASIQFYLPFKAYVLLTWQVLWTNDSNDDDKESHIRLFIDGEREGESDTKDDFCNVRRVRRTMFATDPVGDDTKFHRDPYLRDRYKSRYWSGHQWLPLPGKVPLAKGFHSASLRVIQSKDVKQTRIRARSMKVMFFKAKDD